MVGGCGDENIMCCGGMTYYIRGRMGEHNKEYETPRYLEMRRFHRIESFMLGVKSVTVVVWTRKRWQSIPTASQLPAETAKPSPSHWPQRPSSARGDSSSRALKDKITSDFSTWSRRRRGKRSGQTASPGGLEQ